MQWGSVYLVISYMLLGGMMDRHTLILWRLMIPRQMSGPRLLHCA
uniref:Alternative protein KLHL5 n=1 Tax=Homo sapiens TaxID=9606 RepID=L8E8A1_HUMAN|nr:alternative protein KLHL5 [Homo sapiens]